MSEPAPIVLVVDDEIQIRRFLRTGFELNGFVVHEAGTGTEAIRAATLRPIDIVIVDLGLPDMDGSEVVERIRSWSTVPIIVLSVRSSEAQKVRLLEIGADDYVVKPFSPRELVARVKAVLRRGNGVDSKARNSKNSPFVVDESRCKITFYSEALDLSKYELRILSLLIKWPGRVFSRAEIMDRVWDSPEMSLERTIDSHIKSLRAQLEAVHPGREAIITHRGLGYSLREDW